MDEPAGIRYATVVDGSAVPTVQLQPVRGLTDWLRHDVPPPIAILLAMNVFLVVAPVVDFLLGSPFGKVRDFLSLNAENTLQSWYSSMQWYTVGALFGLCTLHAHRHRQPGALAVGMFALACVAFSVDEIAGIHEWLGMKSDRLLPGGARAHSVLLSRTGLWPFLIGVPAVAVLTMIVRGMRRVLLKVSPRAWRLLVLGLVLMFTGALLLELCANFFERVPMDPGLNLAQQVAEEFVEMLGATFVAWAGLELLRSQGYGPRLPV